MAYGNNDIDVSSYLNGVPVKISEKFKPPAKISLPFSFNHGTSPNFQQYEYDFSTEWQALEYVEQKRKERDVEVAERERRAQLEQEKADEILRRKELDEQEDRKQIEDMANGENSTNKAVLPDEEKECSSPVQSISQSQSSVIPQKVDYPLCRYFNQAPSDSNIMQPMISRDVIGINVNGEPPDLTRSSSTRTNNIKFEDFEAESSPFDNVELKTINDFEELRHVLQGMSSTTGVDQAQAQPHSVKQSHQGLSSATPPFTGQQGYDYTQQKNYQPYQYPGANPANQRQYYGQDSSQGWSSLSGWPVTQPQAFNQQGYGANSWNQGSGYPARQPYPPTSDQSHFYNPQPSLNPGYVPASQPQSIIHPYYANLPALKPSRSTPDLLKELNGIHGVQSQRFTAQYGEGGAYGSAVAGESMSMRNLPSPPRPNSVGPIPNNHKIFSVTQTQPDSVRRQSLAGSTVQDARPTTRDSSETSCSSGQLSRSQYQRLVRDVVDMGFPTDRVEKAIAKIGPDEKKVVEHLCQTQILIDKGFSPNSSQAALFYNDNDEAQAIAFLELASQLQSLGFGEEAVTNALTLHKNDRDKALDYLVS